MDWEMEWDDYGKGEMWPSYHSVHIPYRIDYAIWVECHLKHVANVIYETN